ncbi:MAG: mRNA surveillance protein pelota [Candidatus Verstraetearchaeota archaeon]|nr:mRNA surveillance protein pelota [Candidatus Verstraetearchaeota archaeon]
MRIIEADKKRGYVEVEIEDQDDLWHLYNIVDRGDRICGYTTREIKVSRGDSEERVGRRRVFLCVVVEETGFQSFTGKLRIRGRVVSAPEDVEAIGSYHSFSVGPKDRIGITKEKWLTFHEERLELAATKSRPKVVVITLDDQEAFIHIVKDYEVKEVVSLSSNMPGKYIETSDRTSVRAKYFSSIEDELLRTIKGEPYSVVVAGPGFTKNELTKYLKERHRTLSIAEESTASIGEPGVLEVINRGAISRILKDTSMVRDSELVDEMLMRLSRTPQLVAYGISEVKKAVNSGAVEKLLVSERMMKNLPSEEKRGVEELCKIVEKYGGKAYFVGGEHEKGKQLFNVGGIAALLRFRIG